jgi:hypothetical protein
MSNDDDRGWNIVGGLARPEWLAKLLGASRSGETSHLDKIVLAALALLATKAVGLW